MAIKTGWPVNHCYGHQADHDRTHMAPKVELRFGLRAMNPNVVVGVAPIARTCASGKA